MFLRNSSLRIAKAAPITASLLPLRRTFSKKAFSANIEAYFTPDDNCKKVIIDEIRKASVSIHLQTYIFTCKQIAKEISRAKERGIDVKIIMDKSQFENREHLCTSYLADNNISIWSDYKPAIAHSKIIIIDKNTILTGSFNLTIAAQKKNVENLLVIRDKELADFYFDHWEKRQTLSKRMT